MEEKQICCCESSGWTRVIAWFQIIGAVYGCSTYTFAVYGEIAWRSVDGKNAIKQPAETTPVTPEEIQAYKIIGINTLVDSIVMLLLALLAFFMGTVLLRGSTKGNPRLINYWIVYTVICNSVLGAKAIFEWYRLPKKHGDREFAIMFIAIGCILAIQVFCVWVVWTHKKEIQASSEPVLPVKISGSKNEEP